MDSKIVDINSIEDITTEALSDGLITTNKAIEIIKSALEKEKYIVPPSNLNLTRNEYNDL